MKNPRSWLTIAVTAALMVMAALLAACAQNVAGSPTVAAAPSSTAPQASPTPEPSPTADMRVYFDDSGAEQMVLGNGYYEVALLKANGGIVYIRDKESGQPIVQGSAKGCLWSAEFVFSPSSLEACGKDLTFSYAWSQADQTLTLTYAPDPAAAKQAAVTVTLAAAQEPWFDLQLTLKNDWGYTSGDIDFPAGLEFERGAIREALLPILPGIVLEQGFFQQGRSYQAAYPGAPGGVFADFVAVTSQQGSFAMYSTNPQGSLTPVVFGFDQANCAGEASTCLTHTFRPRVPDGQTWTSPRVRVLISGGWEAAVARFREDDGLAASDSLAVKTGGQYERVTRSVLYKADTAQLGMQFNEYPALLARLPQPGLLHVMAYPPGGFDRNYPDMLPPDPRWGSTAEMAQMFADAQALDFLVMPYTNPTWWDGKSPTLRNLPAGTSLAQVVAANEMGGQYEECYGCPTILHYGYVVSPFADFVRQRLEALMGQMTGELGSDLVFEDQIGARPALFDYNPASPTTDAYIQGWVEHARTYRSALLATENGFDRLVPYEVGFHGSTLLSERAGQTDAWWGSNNWHYYPFAVMAAGDKALFYQHNLAPETFTHNLPTLTWNAAMGYMLSYDLVKSDFGGGLDSDWITLAADFQRYVLGQFAGERILAYSQLEEDVTRTEYAHFSVTANWSKQDGYASGAHVLAAQGLLVQKDDGSLTAGVFTTYNGQALESGGHCLIEERGADEIVIRQPLGKDTPLTLQGLPGWAADVQLEARAFTRAGELIGTLPVTWADEMAAFTYQRVVAGKDAAYYTLAPAKP